MFTGLVQKKGKIEELDIGERSGRIVLGCEPWDTPLQEGESIAVHGICLTLQKRDDERLSFDVLQETFDCTSLREKKVGHHLNLERALRMGDPMGGHIVQGHVDGVGRVTALTPVGRDWRIEIACDDDLLSNVVYKGSMSCDGISLTVAELKEKSFVVHIIPFTWEHTSIHEWQVGDAVNLEVDILAKYARRSIERGKIAVEVEWEDLRKSGLVE